MKKIIIPTLLVCALGLFSCENNLDIPQKGVVSTGDYYASDADAEAALADMYANYVQNVAGTQGIDNPEQVILNYSADDILAAGGNKADHLDFRVYDEFRYDESNPVLKECYNRYVGAIYHANLVISNLSTENRAGTEPKYQSAFTKQCVEEARVMRAYLHFMMAAIWNRPAILDRLLEPDEMPIQAESQEQVFKWVISECDKAINSGSLPKRNGTGDKNSTARMTVGFAQFVAGKAAMFVNDPATARKYLGALISSGDYKLVDSDEYWTNFHVAGDGNSEKILSQTSSMIIQQDSGIMYGVAAGWLPTYSAGVLMLWLQCLLVFLVLVGMVALFRKTLPRSLLSMMETLHVVVHASLLKMSSCMKWSGILIRMMLLSQRRRQTRTAVLRLLQVSTAMVHTLSGNIWHMLRFQESSVAVRSILVIMYLKSWVVLQLRRTSWLPVMQRLCCSMLRLVSVPMRLQV